MDDEWSERAACKNMGPGLFYSDVRSDQVKARAVCDRCPVWSECLTDALEWPAAMDFGIRGGLTAAERADMREQAKVVRRRLDPTADKGRPEAVESRPPHGTPEGYHWERRHGPGGSRNGGGKTCPACRYAEDAFRGRLADENGPLGWDDPRHGTARGFRLGCRDDLCPASPTCSEAEKDRYNSWYAKPGVAKARNARRRRS